MITPIIITCQDNNVLLFNSSSDAESYIEAIDVKNDEYLAYDADGRSLGFKIVNCGMFELVKIIDIKPITYRKSNLCRSLTQFFLLLGTDKGWLRNATLQELVSLGIERYRTQ
jgi:hypothetical protein